MKEQIKKCIQDSVNVKMGLLENDLLLNSLEELASKIVEVFSKGHKMLLCGNGGSASDALHFAGEIVGRFQKERNAWPAIVLNADVSTLTAIANDYGYADVFARQTQGYASPGDIFIGISTSGNSENIYRATKVAKEKGCITAAFLGRDGGKIAKEVDYPIIVPCNITARVQESHILLVHIVCEILEGQLD